MPEKKLEIQNPVNFNNPVDFDNFSLFISKPQNSPEMEKSITKTENTKHKPIPIQDRPKTDKNGRELKRKRYNLLLIPSLYEDIEKIAYVQNISANEAINRALRHYLEKEKRNLEKYTEIERLKTTNTKEND
jgi:hypothetical protein